MDVTDNGSPQPAVEVAVIHNEEPTHEEKDALLRERIKELLALCAEYVY